MQGKIIKGIAGFYYVDVAESGVYECKAKGIFRKEKKKPLVGDNVEIEVLDEKEKTGNLIQILPRKNEKDIDIVSTDFLPDLGERLQNGSMAGESGGHFCDPLIAFMMVYNAVKGNYKDFAGKFEDVPFPYLYVSSAEDYAAYEKYFVDQLPYTDDELVAMSKESLKELKATAASVSIADAESRAAK